jgi:hypothetical protein
MTGRQILKTTVVSGTSNEVQVPPGFTLVGIDVPELTSTSFTITHALNSGGTFKTLRAPLAILGITAGSDIVFTMGSTSIGVYVIPPSVSALISDYMKIVTSSSETAGISLIFQSIA